MNDKFFYCKGKRLADYLIKHGSIFIGDDKRDGHIVYVFENDSSIDENLNKWEADAKRCLF